MGSSPRDRIANGFCVRARFLADFREDASWNDVLLTDLNAECQEFLDCAAKNARN